MTCFYLFAKSYAIMCRTHILKRVRTAKKKQVLPYMSLMRMDSSVPAQT